MFVETFYIKYHLPMSSQGQMFRVVANDRQIVDLMENERSCLWPHLQGKAMEKLGLEQDSLPGMFGRIILGQLREGLFSKEVIEIDLTGVHFELPQKLSFWARARMAIASIFRPKQSSSIEPSS